MDQQPNTSIRHRLNRKQIEHLLSLQAKSNCTIKDFCNEHNLSTANFHNWKRRYKNVARVNQSAPGFAPIKVTPTSPTNLYGLFAEVGGISIYQPVSASFLKELIQ
ncbi:MAG: hypothetical protein NVSMB67_30990 [Flavisolibacter sp.]